MWYRFFMCIGIALGLAIVFLALPAILVLCVNQIGGREVLSFDTLTFLAIGFIFCVVSRLLGPQGSSE